MSRNVAPAVQSGADSLITQMGEENLAGHCRSVDGDEPRVDFLSAAATEDKDYLRLSDGEFDAMCERLDDLHDIHQELIQALERFAEMICTLTSGTTAPEVDALRGLAMAHAARLSAAGALLDELQQALEWRPLDDLLRALSGPEIDHCECEFSEPAENQ